MVKKTTRTKAAASKKGRAKVGKLKVNRETVRALSGGEKKQIKGGVPAYCHPSRQRIDD